MKALDAGDIALLKSYVSGPPKTSPQALPHPYCQHVQPLPHFPPARASAPPAISPRSFCFGRSAGCRAVHQIDQKDRRGHHSCGQEGQRPGRCELLPTPTAGRIVGNSDHSRGSRPKRL